MAEPEPKLAQAEHHVREDMKRIEHQAALVVRLSMEGRWREAIEAKKLYLILEESLRLAQEHLRRLREASRAKRQRRQID